MKQYIFLILTILASSLLKAKIQKPNVVIIFIDDMGYGDVGFNGATGPKTPHLDRMAKEGMIFSDFYVGCAVCSGSRTSLLTGSHYQRVSMNAVLFPQSSNGLHPDEQTIADMLKDNRYKTACVGKWHLGHLPPCLPTYQGFDSYYGVPYSNDMWLDPANKLAKNLIVREGLTRKDVEDGHKKKNWVPLMRGEEIIEYPANQKTLTKRYTEESIKFIKKTQTKTVRAIGPIKLFFADVKILCTFSLTNSTHISIKFCRPEGASDDEESFGMPQRNKPTKTNPRNTDQPKEST